MEATHSSSIRPPTDEATLHGGSRARRRRALVAAIIGNGLEMYDFTIYSLFAATIGRLYFPSDNPLSSLMLSFAIFGAGFLMRPLGAVCIGHFADSRGRKVALTLTIWLMAGGTALIAFAPDYQTAGLLGTTMVVLGRLLQGLAAGGEVGAASALLMESAATNNRCYLVSWQTATQGGAALFGALIGAGLSVLLTPEQLLAWGWRVPFLIGLLIAPVGMYIRRNLDDGYDTKAAKASIAALFNQHWREMLLGTLLLAGGTAGIYINVFYMPTYLVHSLRLPASSALLVGSVSGAVILVMSPVFGRLADRYDTRKPIVYFSAISSLVWSLPTFLLLSSGVGLPFKIMAVGVAVAFLSASTGAGFALIMEGLSRHHRATGLSIIVGVSVTVFGGFSPLISTWLISKTGSAIAPAWYLMATLAFSLVAMTLYPNHPGRD